MDALGGKARSLTGPAVLDSYELSPTQEGMLFHALVGEATGVDLEQIVCKVRGSFDPPAFVNAFERVMSRHEILRSRVSYEEGERPVQQVLASAALPVGRLDLRGLVPAESERRYRDALQEDRARGIDLGVAPAMRLLFVDCGAEHRIVWTFHHALLDGRSFPIVLREVFAFYEAERANERLDLPLPRPYREYIGFLRGLDMAAAEAYWRTSLSGFGAPTPLSIERGTPDETRIADVQGVRERRLSEASTRSLRDFAGSMGVTLNTLFQAAWALVLHRYSRETDIVFGATRACRRSAFEDADAMVGLFINTLPLRVSVDPELRLEEFLKVVRACQVGLRDHEHTPLVKVQGWSEIPRGRPLFDTILVYENRTLDETLRSLDPGRERFEFSYHGQTNYPLTLIAYGDDEMLIRLENDRRRVDDAAASRALGHVVTLLTAMPTHGERKLHELPLLSDDEKAAAERDAVAAASFAPDRCLHERFEERVARHPDRIAAVCDGEALSYGALDRRANALALKLVSLGVRPDVLVGIRTERSLNIVVGILGILKAGGAYLPLDPAYPKDRVEFMLADSRVAVVVTESAFAPDFESSGATLVLLDGPPDEAGRGPSTTVAPQSLAYVIYTSGSTGKPKGVLISHFNVTRLFDATHGWYGFGEDDVWTLFHSYAFDFSVWEIWGALLNGGRLVVVPFWVSRSPEAFHELLLREGVTVLNQTPSAFRQLIQVDVQSGPVRKTALRHVIFGGEALELQSLRPWFDRHGDREPQLINMYGITETTVHVTYRPISLADLEAGAGSVIGVPIPDLSLLLLDSHGNAVPTGVAAEMYVGGGGVSRGYLGRPELTAQRFISSPFINDRTARLYRTGDLARRTENGDVEYLGRIDDQVKIRGFRIELGEIEAVLGQHPEVTEAVVLVRQDGGGDKRLVAYVAGEGDPTGLVDRLKAHLRGQLPEYMVPAHFVVLPRLPLTPNGKVDRKALPAPDYSRLESSRPFVGPRTPTEETLASIWASVLGAPRVSIDDNFFELGGDSILTIQVIARCRQAGLRFSPRDLAKRPTVASLAGVVGFGPDATTKEVDVPQGRVAPTPIQAWFFDHLFASPNHWNQAFLFEVPSGLDGTTFQEALAHVVAHHDALRLRAAKEPEGWTLTHEADPKPPVLERVDLSAVPEDAVAQGIATAAADAQRRLDIAFGPLVAAVHFERGAATGRVLLVVHHLAVDGVSWRLLIEDLEAAYRALRTGTPVSLPPRSASFQRWSRALSDYAASPRPLDALLRWKEIGAVSAALPSTTSHDGPDTEAHARTIAVSLDEDETQALLQRAPAAYRTQINDVLLTSLAQTLRSWTGREAHRIEIEGHGREEWIGGGDLSRTVGWFTTLYPVALDLGGATDDGTAIKRVKEALRQVPDHGLSYGVLRHAAPDAAVRTQLESEPPAELLFNYLGQFDQVVAGSTLFRFANESSGAWHGPANERTHRLEVVCLVRNGRFEARWIHGALRDEPTAMERLAHGFLTTLRRLIQHCVTPGVSGYTPSDFPMARIDQASLDRLVAANPELEDVYPLSPMQRLFLSMEEGSGRLGFEQWVFRLRGDLDAARLRAAWEGAIERHAMLRTSFAVDDVAEPLALVQRRALLPWTEEDWRGAEKANQDERLAELLRKDRERGFDVRVAPLNRVSMIRLADEEHRLIWSTHHLYVDGWSWPLIFQDVAAFYDMRGTSDEQRRPVPCSYASYIAWLLAEAPDSSAFWKEALRGFSSPTPLPFASGPQENAAVHAVSSAKLTAATTAALHGVARSLQVTLNTVVQGCWAILLGHWSRRDDVVFGAAFSGRPAELPGVETLVGPCVNNLPVRVHMDPDRSVADWLRELHQRNLEIAQHQYASLAQIQEWAGVPWRLRLFDSLVVFQNYVVGGGVTHFGAVGVETISSPDETNYPVTVTVTPGPQLDLKVDCLARVFAPATAERMLDGLGTLLADVAERSDARLSEWLSSLPAETKGAAAGAPAVPSRLRPIDYVAPGNEMERAVAQVWQELFQVDRVGMDDNFFDLGGHSILLIQAHARLRERVAKDLSIVALLQYPTVRSLAAYLSNGAEAAGAPAAARDRARLQREALARQRNLRGRR